MEAKDYKYVSELSNEVLKYWRQSTFTMRKRNTTAPDQPCSIQRTIAHTQPPETNTIVTNKKSRFTSIQLSQLNVACSTSQHCHHSE